MSVCLIVLLCYLIGDRTPDVPQLLFLSLFLPIDHVRGINEQGYLYFLRQSIVPFFRNKESSSDVLGWSKLLFMLPLLICHSILLCRSIVGTGLSQFRSRTLRFTLPLFSRFRNSEDRYFLSLFSKLIDLILFS